MQTLFDLSLKLFNAIPAGAVMDIQVKQTLKYGVIIAPEAAYAKAEILAYLDSDILSGEQLNTTFHKSWERIQNSSRAELMTHQVLHYLTTYGTDFKSDFIYIPVEQLELPEIKSLPVKIIRGLEQSILIQKSLSMLESGIALEEQTIDELLKLLHLLEYQFQSVDQIRNKEALIKIIAKTGVYPSKPVEFLRYLIYLVTDSTLLIKNQVTIEAIKEKKLNITAHLNAFGLEKCATIFNRFKPLWLAFKAHEDNIPLINKISKLSKTHHQAMPVDVLNTVTSIRYEKEEILEALKGANAFRKIRLLNALNIRINAADAFLYRIRNGKSFSKADPIQKESDHLSKMFQAVYRELTGKTSLAKKESRSKDAQLAYFKTIFEWVYEHLVDGLAIAGKRVLYPVHIDYALPASEKMFIGNIPTGTKVTSENLVSGVYWKNEWGARDLDLSGLSLKGKIGWNSAYKGKGILYSGDITNAHDGATELLYTEGGLSHPTLSMLNIYSGAVGCTFKMILGNASKITSNYMFDPNELILEVQTEMKSRQQILGIFIPEDDGRLSFILVNTGFGNLSVSGGSEHTSDARKALFYQYANPLSFKQLLIDAGARFVQPGEEFDLDLRVEGLQKDSFTSVLEGEGVRA